MISSFVAKFERATFALRRVCSIRSSRDVDTGPSLLRPVVRDAGLDRAQHVRDEAVLVLPLRGGVGRGQVRRLGPALRVVRVGLGAGHLLEGGRLLRARGDGGEVLVAGIGVGHQSLQRKIRRTFSTSFCATSAAAPVSPRVNWKRTSGAVLLVTLSAMHSLYS